MLRPDELRAEADRCFRLARGVTGTSLAKELEALGRKFEYEAKDLEAVIAGEPTKGAEHRAGDLGRKAVGR
jgi:hypothetical protein